MAAEHGTTINKWTVILGIAVFVMLGIFVPGVVKMVISSILLAYILDPLITALEVRGLSRTLGTLLFFVLVLGTIWILIIVLAPLVSDQIHALQSGAGASQANAVILKVQTMVRDRFGWLGLGSIDLVAKLNEAKAGLGERMMDFLVKDGPELIVYAVAIPFVVFFLLKDGRNIKKAFISVVPNRYFEFTLDLLHKMDMQLGNYLRSQFTDAVAFGILTTIALGIMNVKYFLFIGPFAGMANLIPYVGPIAGALPALIVTLFDTGDLGMATTIIIVFIVLKLADDVLIQPTVVASGVNLHPLLVLLAIIIGGDMFGMLGMLLAVPATGFVKVVLQESLMTLRKYRFTE
jgi:putative permease